MNRRQTALRGARTACAAFTLFIGSAVDGTAECLPVNSSGQTSHIEDPPADGGTFIVELATRRHAQQLVPYEGPVWLNGTSLTGAFFTLAGGSCIVDEKPTLVSTHPEIRLVSVSEYPNGLRLDGPVIRYTFEVQPNATGAMRPVWVNFERRTFVETMARPAIPHDARSLYAIHPSSDIDVSMWQYAGSTAVFLIDPTQVPGLVNSDGAINNAPQLAAGAASIFLRKIQGVVADGKSRLLVVAFTKALQLHVKFPHGGVVTTLEGAVIGVETAVSTLPSNHLPGYPRVGVAVYTPPDNPRFTGIPRGSRGHVEVRSSQTPSAPYPFTAPLWMVRTPVILIHGRASDGATWSVELLKAMRSNGHNTPEVDNAPVPTGVTVVDYRVFSNDGFDPSIPPMGVEALHQGYVNTVQRFRDMGFVTTSVDVVGHSMGGLLARSWIQQPYYAVLDPYRRGVIRRLVTLGTPHLGSRIATHVNEYFRRYKDTDPLYSTVNRILNVSSQAVKDLIPGSTAYRNLRETCVPSHAIVGDYLPAMGGITPGGLKMKLYDELVQLALLMPPIDAVQGMSNDTVVDVVSQAGGLAFAHVSVLPSSVHNGVPGLFNLEAETSSPAAGSLIADILARPRTAFADCLPSPSVAGGGNADWIRR